MAHPGRDLPSAVYLELGRKRVFAVTLSWPGWCRSGRDEAAALEALRASEARYRAALRAGGVDVGNLPNADALHVVERLEGSSGTDFGVPSLIPETDRTALAEPELGRLDDILVAAWRAFEQAALGAAGGELRTGPRGGGRSLARIVDHVRETDAAYLVQLGSARPTPGPDTPPIDAEATVRGAARSALRARAAGQPVERPNRVSRPWPPRYYVRRAAWHALDHAWEIEDRAA
jgi:hypothetical protein